MKTLRRLYLRDFFVFLSTSALGLSIIFSLLDLSTKVDDFMPGKPSAGKLALYSFYGIPRFLVYLLPMSVLISSLFTFGQAVRRKEIIAIKSAGGRMRTFFLPFVAAGVALSIFSLLVGEVVAPDFSQRALDLKHVLEGKAKRASLVEGGLWIRSKDGNPVKMDLYDPERKAASGVVVFVIGQDLLKEKIVAERAAWDGSAWVLENITRYDFATGRIDSPGTMRFPTIEAPDYFAEDVRKVDEMGIVELYRYMQRLREAGFRNVKLDVDVNSKISFPLINSFMMLLGLALSLRTSLGGGLFSAGLGLIIALVYWLGYTFFLSMGYTGVLHPLVAAWTVPLLFGACSVYLYVNIPE